MQINLDWSEAAGTGIWVDIDSFLGEKSTEPHDHETVHRQFLMYILGRVMTNTRPPKNVDHVWISTYQTDDGDDINVDGHRDWTLRAAECLDLAMWTNARLNRQDDLNRAHAFLSEDWNAYANQLDDLEYKVLFTFVANDYHSLGKEVAEVFDLSVDESLDEYMDWERYGESYANENTELTWDGTSYILSE